MALGNSEVLNGQVRVSHAESREHEIALYAKRTTEIPSNQKMRIEYSGSNAIYVGFAPTGLAEGTDGWIIQKFTYDGSNNVTQRNIAYGNWTARSGYTYE